MCALHGFYIFHVLLSVAQPLYIPLCEQNQSLELRGFTLSNGIDKPIYDTNVFLCYNYNPSILWVRYEMNDNSPSSPYTECNQNLWKSDAVEMFITTSQDGAYATKYIEIELNPNGALFLSLITNTCDNCDCISGDLQPCSNKNAVQFYNASVTETSWSAQIGISLDWISNVTSTSSGTVSAFKANFFRVDDISSDVTQLSCYNPTDKTPPCFHVPSKFIEFTLQDVATERNHLKRGL